MESIISTFHIDWKIILAQAINFAAVVAVLYFFALKPLKKLLSERSDKIERGLADAKSNAELLERTKSEYETALSKARKDAQVIFEEGKKEALTKREEMLREAKTETERVIEAGRKKMEEEKEKMVMEAKSEVAELTIAATEKLLGKMGGSYDEKLIKELSKA